MGKCNKAQIYWKLKLYYNASGHKSKNNIQTVHLFHIILLGKS